MNRADKIKACRPYITIKESKNTSDEEQFQNQVLRYSKIPKQAFYQTIFVQL